MSIPTTGSIEVTIRIRLNADITEEQAREFVREMDYSITAPDESISIADTEVIGDDLDDRFGCMPPEGYG